MNIDAIEAHPVIKAPPYLPVLRKEKIGIKEKTFDAVTIPKVPYSNC